MQWDWENMPNNPNITWDIIKNDSWDWESLSRYPNITWDIETNIETNIYYESSTYKKQLVKEFLDNCWEELIKKACHPSRILNWNDDYLEDCKNGSDEERDVYLAECNKYM
jgi:hypothetical protein